MQSKLEALEALGVSVVAASVDSKEKALEVAKDLAYPIAYGISRAGADSIGAWWEERRGIIQPSEFLIGADNRVMAATYSTGPIGRIDPADVVSLVGFYESRKA